MAILLLIVAFTLTGLFIFSLDKSPFIRASKNAIFKSTLLIASIIFCFTEVLSIFNLLTYNALLVFWGMFLMLLIFLIWRKKIWLKFTSKLKDVRLSKPTQQLLLIVLAASILVLIPLFIIAIKSPPYTYDVLTYHLPRIEHWIQNQNVWPYPTNCARQNLYPPLGEYLILQSRLLSNSDLFNSFPQLLALFLSALAFSDVTRLLGGNSKLQCWTYCLALLLPELILFSTTSKNDIVAILFFSLSLVYGFRIIKNKFMTTDIVLFALAISFALLTKPNAGIFALPFCIWIAITLLLRFKLKALLYGSFIVAIFLSINSPYYYRNYQISGKLLSDDPSLNFIRNDEMNMKLLSSNIIRNIASQLSLPDEAMNRRTEKVVRHVHQQYLGIHENNKANTLKGDDFMIRFKLREEVGNNFLQTILILLIPLFLLLNKKVRSKPALLIYFLSLVIGFLLYSAIFKWGYCISARFVQISCISSIPIIIISIDGISIPKHRQLKQIFLLVLLIFLSYFSYKFLCLFVANGLGLTQLVSSSATRYAGLLIFTTLILLGFYRWRHEAFGSLRLIVILCAVQALPYLTCNFSAPILQHSYWESSREDKQPHIAAFRKTFKLLESKQIEGLALDIRNDGVEYPYWQMNNRHNPKIESRYIRHTQTFKGQRNYPDNFQYQVLLTDANDWHKHFPESSIQSITTIENTSLNNLRLIYFKSPQHILF